MRLIVRGGKPLRGVLSLPGDKSVAHRAIIFGALGVGVTRISGFSGGEDNLHTLGAMAALGVRTEVRDTEVLIGGVGLRGLAAPGVTLDAGNSGSTMRFLAGLLAGQPFSSRLDGDASLRRRPMRRVVEPLTMMGGCVVGSQGARPSEIYPPLEIRGLAEGTRLQAIDYRMPVAIAQVKTALLLAGLYARGVTRVREPYLSRDHTERLLAYLGLPVRVCREEEPSAEIDGDEVRPYLGQHVVLPGDFSSAAFLVAAALLVPQSRVVLRDVGVNPTRTGLLDALAQMGAHVPRGSEREVCGEPVADLTVSHGDLQGARIAGGLTVRAIDEVPILAVVATQAHGTTELLDAAELRVKESDRLAAMAAELCRLGARVEEHPDGLSVEGPCRLRGTTVYGHKDHRVAMALTVAGLVAEGETVIEDADAIAVSYPGFAEALVALGADVRVGG